MGDDQGKPSAVIRDGEVSGVLPEASAFSVHYPGYPSSTERAIETLGGLAEIAKARSSETSNLELRFRPEDPYSHPTFGEIRASTSLLLRIRKTRGEEQSHSSGAGEGGPVVEPTGEESLSAEIVSRVNRAYTFEGMIDYQYVIGVHAAEARGKKRPWTSDEEPELEQDGIVDMDGTGVMMLVPPLFSLKDRPENIVLNPPAKLFSKSIQKGVMEHKWEMYIEPCLAIPFEIEKIPKLFNWEDHISKDTIEWECQFAVSNLFKEKPIWPRWSLYERLRHDGHQVSANHLKRLLFRAGYYFSTGPFGRFWIRKGYDPRIDPESRIFQKVDFRVPLQLRCSEITSSKAEIEHAPNPTQKELCHFQVWPSKTFTCLQLAELDDDYIQQEIRKPTQQKTCTDESGWFLGSILRILRLHVSLQYLSVCPNKAAAAELINYTRELLAKCKTGLSIRKKKPKVAKEDQLVEKDTNCLAEVRSTPCNDQGHANQDALENIYTDNEEEEEFDGYESPTLAREGGIFPDNDEMGEEVPNAYLEELLRGFPFNKRTEYQQPDKVLGADGGSDDEYQIFEQDSDDNEDLFAD
ncbi:general transcription factor 3C polypeptide 5-like [Zingiber officinale]|uniref:general transcription factor 3C polypeptide 5-like n=1 Tax=Zingiber officinale TaxID=94328 RepID=UPI001C4C905B|nr:general transcription factor 3C polypeptide 5-like [Zingiber officinale]